MREIFCSRNLQVGVEVSPRSRISEVGVEISGNEIWNKLGRFLPEKISVELSQISNLYVALDFFWGRNLGTEVLRIWAGDSALRLAVVGGGIC
jgi:hypothetical protein